MSGRNFKERGMLMKQCYEQLDLLYRRTISAENESSGNELTQISEEYQGIVNSSENHKEMDFLISIFKLRMSGDKIDKNLTWYMNARVVLYFVFRLLYLALFYTLPLWAMTVIHCI